MVVVGGWGVPVEALNTLLPKGVETTALAPARMAAANGALTDALDAVIDEVPEGALWLGWSLGGQVAMAAQERFPDRVGGVLTLCSTPCFVAAPDWPAGMAPADFNGFREGLAGDPGATLRRFCSLVSQGSTAPRAVRRELQALEWPEVDTDRLRGLAGSLEWLATLDQRDGWRSPRGGAWHLFGARDALVDADTPRALGLASERFSVVPDAGHWPVAMPGVADWISDTLERVTT
ncbi:MAG: alpha/beta fold hydrolase [Pseudomonadota bacterium]